MIRWLKKWGGWVLALGLGVALVIGRLFFGGARVVLPDRGPVKRARKKLTNLEIRIERRREEMRLAKEARLEKDARMRGRMDSDLPGVLDELGAGRRGEEDD